MKSMLQVGITNAIKHVTYSWKNRFWPKSCVTGYLEEAGMEISKEELVVCIEKARKKLEDSIEGGAEYSYIYENSVELDRLIEIYIAMEY